MNSKEIQFAENMPYPPICIREKNCEYAEWILDNVGGANSEMSAVSLYFYNSVMTEDKYEDISYIFHKISVVEMHHMDIFAKLAHCLGEEPRMWTQVCGRKRYWTPCYNNYPLDLEKLIYNALRGEEAAIAKYEEQIACIEQENVVENLQRIILDERLHVSIYEKLIREYCL